MASTAYRRHSGHAAGVPLALGTPDLASSAWGYGRAQSSTEPSAASSRTCTPAGSVSGDDFGHGPASRTCADGAGCYALPGPSSAPAHGSAQKGHPAALFQLASSGHSGHSGQQACVAPAPPPMQSKMLKSINSLGTKEELLDYVSQTWRYLDPINCVTCVYRLARMFSTIRNVDARQEWRTHLIRHPTFRLLLRSIQAHMTRARVLAVNFQEVKGVDARCVSNLVWALVKLEVTANQGDMGVELIACVSPLVCHFLPTSSAQGLANCLWAYSKLPSPPLNVMMVIVREMAGKLFLPSSPASFDAQALSNSVWALAHTRCKVADLDAAIGMPGAVLLFFKGVASCALRLLALMNSPPAPEMGKLWMVEAERNFSCQALVNLVWSMASMLETTVGTNSELRRLFMAIHAESIIRLRATAFGLQHNQPWLQRIHAGFNEQALSNILYAYDKGGLLDHELLQWVFTVAALRLERCNGCSFFKPQELCTLLRATHLKLAAPWAFLSNLLRAVTQMPWCIATWTQPELAELDRAFRLLERAPQRPGPQPSSLAAASRGGAPQHQQPPVTGAPQQATSRASLEGGRVRRTTLSSLPEADDQSQPASRSADGSSQQLGALEACLPFDIACAADEMPRSCTGPPSHHRTSSDSFTHSARSSSSGASQPTTHRRSVSHLPVGLGVLPLALLPCFPWSAAPCAGELSSSPPSPVSQPPSVTASRSSCAGSSLTDSTLPLHLQLQRLQYCPQTQAALPATSTSLYSPSPAGSPCSGGAVAPPAGLQLYSSALQPSAPVSCYTQLQPAHPDQACFGDGDVLWGRALQQQISTLWADAPRPSPRPSSTCSMFTSASMFGSGLCLPSHPGSSLQELTTQAVGAGDSGIAAAATNPPQ